MKRHGLLYINFGFRRRRREIGTFLSDSLIYQAITPLFICPLMSVFLRVKNVGRIFAEKRVGVPTRRNLQCVALSSRVYYHAFIVIASFFVCKMDFFCTKDGFFVFVSTNIMFLLMAARNLVIINVRENSRKEKE